MSRAEDILKYIKKNNSSTARKFDEHFGARVEEFCQSIAPIFEGLDNAMIGNVGEPPIADHIFQGAQLVWGGLNSLIAAMEILRNGHWKDAGIVARSALETSCCGLHMSQDIAMFDKFRHGEAEYSAAVSFASKLSRTIPRTYGLLSELFTHVSQLHGVLHFDRTTGLGMFPAFREQDKHRYASSLLALEMTASDIEQIFEFIFFKSLPSSKHWQKDTSGKLQWHPNPTIGDKFMRRLIESQVLVKQSLGGSYEMQLPPKEILERLGYSHLIA